MHRLAPLWILLFLILAAALPLLFGSLMIAGLEKLHLGGGAALLIVLGIIFGSMINIPVRRIAREDELTVAPFAVFGLPQAMPQLGRRVRETVIAVNLGGCLIPTGLAVYEFLVLLRETPGLLPALGVAVALNVFACYRLAQPIPGLGIAIPALAPALVAAMAALIMVPGAAPPVAFIAGVVGPLIGADLLHLRDVEKAAAGILSIGGAGTFDGIVLSGIVAAYLA